MLKYKLVLNMNDAWEEHCVLLRCQSDRNFLIVVFDRQ